MEVLLKVNLLTTIYFLTLVYIANCKLQSYGETCVIKDGSSDCDVELGLKCTDVLGKSICACNPSVARDDPAKRLCEGLVSKPCIRNNCVKNAKCTHLCDNFDYKTNKTTTEEICWEQCECPVGLAYELSDPPGFCQAKHKGPCGNSNKNCIPGLKCQNDECSCPKGDHQYYDKTLKKCVTLANGPCDPKKSDCTQNATCTKVWGNEEVFHCVCDDSYVRTGAGSCALSLKLGENCPQDGHICDEYARLYCTDGKCGCEDELHIYDEDFGKCLGLYGSWCSPEQSLSCVSDAYCNVDTVERNLHGKRKGLCECNDDAVLLKDRTCYQKKKYAESCSNETIPGGDCDSDLGLKCIDSLGMEIFRCDCNPSLAKDNPAKRICEGLVNKPCINDTCVENAECTSKCTESEDRCWVECACPETNGFVHSKGLCLAPPGKKCTTSDNCISGFACHGGKCQSKCDETSSIFDSVKNQCVGLVDKNCINDLCVDKAECQFLCDNIDEKSFNLTNYYHLNEDICWNQCLCPTEYTGSPDGKTCVKV